MITTELTPDEYRREASRQERLRELLLTEPALMRALQTLRGHDPCRGGRAISPEADAARANQAIGWHNAIDTLLALAEPLNQEEAESYELPSEEDLERHAALGAE